MLSRYPNRIHFSPLPLLVILGLMLSGSLASCSKSTDGKRGTQPLYVATIQPLASILKEIVGDRGDVFCLLKVGSSPHTYDVTPSDAVKVERARGLFWVHHKVDGWVTSFENPNNFMVFDFVPGDMRREFQEGQNHKREVGGDKHNYDPHFWTSPKVVKAIVPKLVETLSTLDPESAVVYAANGEKLANKLDSLSAEVADKLKPYEGEMLLLLHPSFLYYMDEFGLELAGVIEPFPGKEPTPKYILDLVHIIEEHNVKAIFTEPQLPAAPAETIADETGLPVIIIDPIGGYEGRETYFELIRYNTQQIVAAFSGSD